MSKFLKNFLQDIENYKIYHIIILFTLMFIVLFFNGIYNINNEIKNLAKQNRALIVKDIDYTISSWIMQRIYNLENNVQFLEEENLYLNEKKLLKIVNHLLAEEQFDAIQFIILDNYFYINDNKMINYKNKLNATNKKINQEIITTKWFVNTKKTLKTTIEQISNHKYLNEKTMNICTPIMKNNDFKGVFCGIIKTANIFKKIKTLDIPNQIYHFISDNKGNLLTDLENKKLEYIVKNAFKNCTISQNDKPQVIQPKNNIITIKKLKEFNWYIGVGMDENVVFNEWIEEVAKHAIILTIFFILFLIVINSAYEFLYRRVERKKKEYEKILQHHSKLNEVGELVSSINHQLRQPLNSIALIISNTLDMSQRKLLQKDMLEENLVLCKKSINMMDKTIDIFRNFYRSSEEVSLFCLEECVKGVIHIYYIDLTRNNISIQVQNVNAKRVKSIENFIQQILLVLIQNAKDALAFNKIKEKKIIIKISLKNDIASIDVMDWGIGIQKKKADMIFSQIKRSEKTKGFGLGLFFAKKIANDKLFGDLKILRYKNPTIFRLEFKNLNERN